VEAYQTGNNSTGVLHVIGTLGRRVWNSPELDTVAAFGTADFVSSCADYFTKIVHVPWHKLEAARESIVDETAKYSR